VAAHFDPAPDAGVLGRYAGVLAAFRDPRLWTMAVRGKDRMEVRDDSGKLPARGEMQEALSHPKGRGMEKQRQFLLTGVGAGGARSGGKTVPLRSRLGMRYAVARNCLAQGAPFREPETVTV
jgi:hypothetical protein